MMIILLLVALFWPEDKNYADSGLCIYDPIVDDPDYEI